MFRDLAPELLSIVGPALVSSPFAAHARWGSAVVIIRRDEVRITSRGDFAGWLVASDLRDAARECISRRVPRGSILVWVELDSEIVSAARFVLLDVIRTLRDVA